MKDIAVIGLGKFGENVAKKYAELGGNVMVIDNDYVKIQEISEFVTCAIKADVTDADVVKTLGLSNMDAVIVAMTDNMEAAVMATIFAKEEGVPLVIAKCRSEMHERVLKKVGADKVIFPEKQMGERVAKNLAMNHLIEAVELSENYTVAEIDMPEKWIGKSLVQLGIRQKYGINVVLKKNGHHVEGNIDPHKPFEAGCTLVVIGENDKIEKLF